MAKQTANAPQQPSRRRRRVTSLQRPRSLIAERHLSLPLAFMLPAAVALVVAVVLAASHVELGLNLTVVGLLLALLLPLTLEVRSRTTRTRHVLVLDYRVHQFGHAVARGVMRTLNNHERAWRVEYRAPQDSHEAGSVQFQIKEIQEATLRDIDGLVILPAADDDGLWRALAALVKTGCFVVAVDTKPPQRVFRDVGIEVPRFVSTKYEETGTLTADLVAEFLDASPHNRAMLWTGPDGSWPGEERSRNVVYQLAAGGYLDRVRLLGLDSWVPKKTSCEAALSHLKSANGGLAVYCADDENAMALHLFTMMSEPQLRRRLYIIGCNATRDDWGGIPVFDQHSVDATIDIQSEEQGVQAAMFLIRERALKLDASERSHRVPPRILRRNAEHRWADSLFAEVRDTAAVASFIPDEAEDEDEVDASDTVVVDS